MLPRAKRRRRDADPNASGQRSERGGATGRGVHVRSLKDLDLYGASPHNQRRGGMMAQKRSARIEARIAPEALALVKRAAEIQGRSLSDFVVAAVQHAARRTIEETSL